jgi:hypothetical protein
LSPVDRMGGGAAVASRRSASCRTAPFSVIGTAARLHEASAEWSD